LQNVGGPSSSFGIWFEEIEKVKEIAAKYDIKVVRVHTHIGSGSDPDVWKSVSAQSLDLVRDFPDAVTLNLGGGYKVGRMSTETSTDLQSVGEPVKDAFVKFAEETGREVKLEIEPGTFLTANAGTLLARVQDIVSTGNNGYTFLKLDSGMTEVTRPTMYGAKHPMVVLNENNSSETAEYVVVGHCCESGDIFTCASGDAETLEVNRGGQASVHRLQLVEWVGCGLVVKFN
jgi:diaminopimelate decarboxylase